MMHTVIVRNRRVTVVSGGAVADNYGTDVVDLRPDPAFDGCEAVLILGCGGTAALTTRLADAGFPKRAVVVAGPRDVAKAVSMLTNAVAEHDLAHYGQEELTASATLTAKRRIGSDGVGFEDAGGADSTLIEACALALWQAKTTKRRPGRKAVVY